MRRLLGLIGRLIALAGAVAAGAAVWHALHPQAEAEEIPPAVPIALRPTAAPNPGPVASTTADPAPTAAWVPPVDGSCPPGYPIKSKHGSEVFHSPGGASYDRTRPDRCYRDAAAAEADGLR
ncbi:MAG: hypothetical protein ACKO2C_06170, partial [Actinomycetes bacterium]